MRAPFSFMGGGGGGPPPVDFPSTLNLSMWARTDFAGDPWACSASIGSSGSNSLIDGTAPAVGSPLNGHAPADYDGASTYQVASIHLDAAVTSTAGSMFCLYYARTAPAPATHGYQDPNFVSQFASGSFSFGSNDTNVRCHVFDLSSATVELNVAASLTTWHLAHMRWDSTTLELGIDGVWSASDVISGGGLDDSAWGTAFRFGQSWLNSLYFDGLIAEFMASPTKISDGDTTSIVTYLNSRYALSL